jgi:Family of unknown function (DUF6064)
MPEWWTYRLSDFLMFEARTYYRLFELYNRDLWPGQFLALGIGFLLLATTWRASPRMGPLVLGILVTAWCFVAWAFLWRRYATINLAAPWFAIAFASEALLLLLAALLGRQAPFRRRPHHPDPVGVAVVLFGVVVQPLIGPMLGRPWTEMELFGLAPDPTATATLGVLLAAGEPWPLSVIPLLWCLTTGATLQAMRAPDAWMAPTTGIVVLLVGWRSRRLRLRSQV